MVKKRQQESSFGTRVMLALSAFTITLCGLLYIGFTLKFDANSSPSLTNSNKNKNEYFYKTVGNSTIPQQKPSTAMTAKYAVELKVVNQQSEADAMLAALEKQGIQGYYTPYNSHGRIFYRVRTGAFSSAAQAESLADKIKLSQNVPATVIKLH